jgi:hypothetical protein
LPLKPVGSHSPETTPEEPSDPLPSSDSSASKQTSTVDSGINRPIVSVVPGVDRPVISFGPTETPAITGATSNLPQAPKATGEAEGGDEGIWDIFDNDFFATKVEEIKNWLAALFGSTNKSGQGKGDE